MFLSFKVSKGFGLRLQTLQKIGGICARRGALCKYKNATRRRQYQYFACPQFAKSTRRSNTQIAVPHGFLSVSWQRQPPSEMLIEMSLQINMPFRSFSAFFSGSSPNERTCATLEICLLCAFCRQNYARKYPGMEACVETRAVRQHKCASFSSSEH